MPAGRSPAFLERGALESFTDRVVVRGSWRGAVMNDAELVEVVVEAALNSGPLSVRTPVTWTPSRRSLRITRPGTAPRCGVGRSEEHVHHREAGRGVHRGELPHRSDTFEVADVEAVEGDQVTGTGGEVTEPERGRPITHLGSKGS